MTYQYDVRQQSILDAYHQFLADKVELADYSGFNVGPGELHPSLFPHQRDMVTWATRLGRGLIAASFGLGKSAVQIELARLVHQRTGGKFLIVCPLGVKYQFAEEDGPRMGVHFQYVRTDEEIEAADTPYLITNYERVRDGDIDPRKHDIVGVSLDEGSVLRSLGSKTYQVFLEVFADIMFRWVCTATPAPNRKRELIYYAKWLGVMDHNLSLNHWFGRNPDKAGDLQLHPQHEADFWLFVASWALFLYRPGDLGYSDEGYDLPELRVHYHRIGVDQTRAWSQADNRGQLRLFLDAAGGVREASAEKRATMADRTQKAVEIVNEHPDQHWLIWHHLEDERLGVELAIPQSVSVYGSQEIETREQRILDFSHGKFPILATKPELAGSGCNFQYHCHSNIFLGIDYRFEDFIQAIHRTYRFQQKHPVDVHIIYAESEDQILETLKRKWQEHDELVEKMREIVRKYGLNRSNLSHATRRRSIGVIREQVDGQRFTAIHNDCVVETISMADNSVDLLCTSIPFGNHFQYTDKKNDFGYNDNDDKFWIQMDFLIPELLRVLRPGRVAAIHVKDRILYGHQTRHGFMDVSPFSDECVMAFRKHGWIYGGRRTISTDVVRENNSTYRLGWSEVCKDATKMGSGLPEYLLLFRKPPTSSENTYADEPVTKSKDKYSRGRWQIDAHAPWRSDGNRLLTPEEYAQLMPDDIYAIFRNEQLTHPYNYNRHVEICEALDKRGKLPSSVMLCPPAVTKSDEDWVWDDINFMHGLNMLQSQDNREKHICPLPFDVVERIINLYSNEGDLIFDPFGGLFTVPYCAVKLGRRGLGVELNRQYFDEGVRYLKNIEIQAMAPTLFDWLALRQSDQTEAILEQEA